MIHDQSETIKHFTSLTYFNYIICAIQRLKSLSRQIRLIYSSKAICTHILALVQGQKQLNESKAEKQHNAPRRSVTEHHVIVQIYLKFTHEMTF